MRKEHSQTVYEASMTLILNPKSRKKTKQKKVKKKKRRSLINRDAKILNTVSRNLQKKKNSRLISEFSKV